MGRLVGPVRIWGAGGATCHFGTGGPQGGLGNGRGGYGASPKGSMCKLGHGVGWGSAQGESGVVSWETPSDYLKVFQMSLLGILGSAGCRQDRDFSS